ncbi:hypothetical protein [Paenibacillus lutrae]|uniref:Uncharacterized protein n=1 Tax=Paenibacillus lutrae TaxID=2078573 RepID=A0A7X3JYS9_9BACL|nr:hypothetical protein [Paenibacillus lutrae]MVO99468.1 hypothetical protein [Paenibacillus lutrae]
MDGTLVMQPHPLMGERLECPRRACLVLCGEVPALQNAAAGALRIPAAVEDGAARSRFWQGRVQPAS